MTEDAKWKNLIISQLKFRINNTSHRSGNPRPTIEWRINDKEDSRVTTTSTTTMISLWETVSTLLFRVKEGDTSVTCVAKNNISSTSTTTPLAVLPPPMITDVEFTPNPVSEVCMVLFLAQFLHSYETAVKIIARFIN